MTTIKTDDGEFSGETLADATKQAKAAARRAAKIEAERSKLRDWARTKARAEAWRILDRKIRGESFPRGWRFHEAGSQYSPTKQLANEFSAHRCSVRVETEDGTADESFYGCQFIGTIDKGNGYTMAIVLRNGSQTQILAVAVHEGQLGFEQVDGVALDEFRQPDTTD